MRAARRISQILFLAFFIFLFLAAGITTGLPLPVDLFLKTDPLAAVSASLAGRTILDAIWWSLPLVLLAIFVGRIFCGWACPLGTVLDVASRVARKRDAGAGRSLGRLRKAKYCLLVVLLVSSLLTVQPVWLLDPLVLLMRTTALSLMPIVQMASTTGFDLLYRVDFLQDALARIQSHLDSTLLPGRLILFRWSTLAFTLFLVVVFLELVSRRFFCRYLCPLGALYAALSRFQVLNRSVSKRCSECSRCSGACKMDAILQEASTATRREECILCWNCVEDCPQRAVSIRFGNRLAGWLPVSAGRRAVLASIAGGIFAALALKTGFRGAAARGRLIRPPGSLPEAQFVARCLRCHLCIRACSSLGGALLHPSSLEGGLEAFWTPVGIPRIGYCEFGCVACTRLCPSGAIRPLELRAKQKTRIGLAVIDRSLCIPWRSAHSCIVCEEQCPTHRKAIVLREEETYDPWGRRVTVKRPYVVEELCIGCGVCETKCPLPGKAAIVIVAPKERFTTE